MLEAPATGIPPPPASFRPPPQNPAGGEESGETARGKLQWEACDGVVMDLWFHLPAPGPWTGVHATSRHWPNVVASKTRGGEWTWCMGFTVQSSRRAQALPDGPTKVTVAVNEERRGGTHRYCRK